MKPVSRASISIGGSIPSGSQTQPYNADNPNDERRLDRKPLAAIPLFVGLTDRYLARSVTTNLMGQRSEWFGGTVGSRTEYIISAVSECLNGAMTLRFSSIVPRGSMLTTSFRAASSGR
jgi:hypothetical protein